MNIVIAGEDEIAFRLAEDLMGDHAVVVVTSQAESAKMDRLDVEVIIGLVSSSDTLRRARVEQADVFLACSPHDEQNLVACVVAKRLGAGRAICFLFRSDFRVGVGSSDTLARALGIDEVIQPAEQLAKEILRIVAVPGALDVEAFVGGKVKLFRHAVEEGAPITAGRLMDVGVPSGVVLVMGRRGEEIFIPKGNTEIRPGDKITAMGEPSDMNRLLFKFLKAQGGGRDARRATIVGGGEVGLTVALGMEDAGWHVKVIESDRSRCEDISKVLNSLVLNGDGSDIDLLEEERIDEDSVLISVTTNDEKNLLVSLLAKQFQVPRIITRASSPSYERLFERVGVDVVRSASGAAVRTVLRSFVESRSELLAELEHGDAMILEVRLPGDLPPTPLHTLRAPEFVIVGAILREEQVIIPTGNAELQAGDRALLFCTREYEDEARRFFLTRAV